MNIKEYRELFPTAKAVTPAKKKKLANKAKADADKAKEAAATKRFILLCERFNIPTPQTQVRLVKGRKLTWDFYWDHNGVRLSLELQGAIFVRGGHSTGTGLQRDYEKVNLCVANGIYPMLCSYKMLFSVGTINAIKKALKIS